MSAELRQAWDGRVEKAITELPYRLQSIVKMLLIPSRWWLRVPVAFLFLLGGLLSILPLLGLWMLPLGIALLAEDVPGMKAPLEKVARWIVKTWRRLRGST